MNAITTHTSTPAASMTSKEIAELTGKLHTHVMRDIRAMLTALGSDQSSFGSVYLDAKNEQRPCFVLPKDLTLTLVSGYNVVMRHRIVTRWQELEAVRVEEQPVTYKLPQTYKEALRALVETVEREELALAQVKALEPKALVYDAVVADRKLTLVQFVRTLGGVNTNRIKSDLQLCQYLYKVGTKYRVYAQHRDSLFIEKFAENGDLEIFPTDKGKEVIVQLYRARKLSMKVGH